MFVMPITVVDNYWTRATLRIRLGYVLRPITISLVPVGNICCLWCSTGTI